MLTDSEKQMIERIESLESADSKQALSEILSFLTEKSRAIRLTAVEALAAYQRFPTAKKALFTMLKDKNGEVRQRAIESLQNFTSEDVPSTLIATLNDHEWLIRLSVIEALEYLGAKRATPHLLSMLSDKHELVRGYAAMAIGTLGNKALLPYLYEQLKKETMTHTRVRIYYGLVRLGQHQHIESMIQILQTTESYSVKCAAIHGLTELANRNNVDRLITEFEEMLNKEQPRAVSSTLESSLKELIDLKG